MSEAETVTATTALGMVHTIKGLIARDLLTTIDTVTEEPNARAIATEWFLDGEIVRRDVAVSILQGQSIFVEQADL